MGVGVGVEEADVLTGPDTEEGPCELWGCTVGVGGADRVDKTSWHWGWAANAGTGTENKPSMGAKLHHISKSGEDWGGVGGKLDLVKTVGRVKKFQERHGVERLSPPYTGGGGGGTQGKVGGAHA